MPSFFDAAKVEPDRRTARKTLMSAQLCNRLFISEEQHNAGVDTSGTGAEVVSLCSGTSRKDPEMMTQALVPGIRDIVELLVASRDMSGAAEPTPERRPDSLRRQRDFINDMICEHPNAFASEMDVHSMMCLFPGRF